MTIDLQLSAPQEHRHNEAADRAGLAPEQFVTDLVLRNLSDDDSAARVSLLRSLLDDDEAEQRETGEFLEHAIDDDRLSARKLYR